jgi:hypothetical protein
MVVRKEVMEIFEKSLKENRELLLRLAKSDENVVPKQNSEKPSK